MSWPWEIAASGRTPTYALPTGWSVARVGDITSLENGQPYESKFFGEEGTPLIRIRDVLGGPIETRYSGPSPTSHRVRKGDLLVGMDGDFNVGQWGHDEPGLLNQRVLALEAPPEISAWVGYCLPEPLALINELTYSTTVKHLTSQAVSSIRIPLPDRTNLRRLVDYLDHETAEIDAFIAEQEMLSGLLQERAGSLRTAAWGSYVEGAYKMAPLDPLPAIPSHWRWVRAKNLLQERDRTSITGREELLSVSHLTGVTPRAEKTVHMFEAESTVGYKTVEPGNLIINTMWAWMGALGVSGDFGIASPAYGVYEFHEREIEPRFYDHLLRSAEYVQLMTNHSRGLYSSRLRLYPENFLRLPIPLPPLSEQQQTSAWIDDQFQSMEKTSNLLAHSVDLARERRAALISAAVTGQIDVTKRHRPVAEVLEDEVRELV